MANEPDKPRGAGGDRARIAFGVLVVSCVVVTIVSIAMIALSTDSGSAAERAFTMLVPMVGTWVGTVIAYYFSGENFDRASQGMSRLVDQVILDKLKSIPVSEAMMARSDFQAVKLAAGDDGSGKNLKTDVLDRFKDPVTRLPVLDDTDRAKYVVHQSMVFKYISDRALNAPPNQAFDVTQATLKDFLDHPGMLQQVGAMAFVAENGTLADAKTRMEAVPRCQDVFVTADGTPSKPVIGWLPNVDIAKRAQA